MTTRRNLGASSSRTGERPRLCRCCGFRRAVERVDVVADRDPRTGRVAERFAIVADLCAACFWV